MNPASLLRQFGCRKISIRVAKEGFDDGDHRRSARHADLPLSLTITAQQTSVTVNEKHGVREFDVVYRQLRNVGLGETFRCENSP